LEQLDRALGTNTNFAWGYYYRGVVKALSNDWDNALADFQRCGNFSDGRLKDYAAIQIWLVQTRTGERERAEQGLLAYCQNRAHGTPADWQMHIARFLLNQISETDFSGAIDSSDMGREQSEFWYYTGMKRLLAGDKAGAGDCFRKSLATKTRPYAVYLSAVAELRSLDTVVAAK
jgi:lipoprotein NlpI